MMRPLRRRIPRALLLAGLLASSAMVAVGQVPINSGGRLENTRVAVFRPSTSDSEQSLWIVRRIDGKPITFRFGEPGDLPAPADYDGKGYVQLAVFRPSTAQWFIRNITGVVSDGIPFGQTGDLPVPADYDGLRKAQLAVFRPSTAEWIIRKVDGSLSPPIKFGEPDDLPAPAWYSLQFERVQIAVFHPSTGQFRIRRPDGRLVNPPLRFGQSGDLPVPAAYKLTVGAGRL